MIKKKNKFYKVKRGDTLYSISEKFNIPINSIISLNNLKGEELNIGQTIKIKK